MAQLVPSGFDVSSLVKSEQVVISCLLQGLDESWWVVPCIPITVDGEDREIDVLIVGHDRGAFVVEVKGGTVTVEDGEWKSYDRPIKNPVSQVQKAKHALIRRLRKIDKGAADIHISHLVALPGNADFPPEGAGPECPRDIVLTMRELAEISHAIDHIGHPNPATKGEIEALLRALRPDIRDIDVDGRHVRGTLSRLSEATGDRLGPVIGLDENKRVYLRGSAGTGKTFVALRWFRRALLRGERTLYVCFNRPLAEEVDGRVATVAEELTGEDVTVPPHMVANFHSLLLRLMGQSEASIPEGEAEDVQRYWNDELPTMFRSRLAGIPERFDTIVIDEAQDFRPEWLEIVESLLVDRSEGRLYLMADSEQAIFTSDFKPPEGITTLELTHNIRNSANIARVVSLLGGAPSPRSTPTGPEVLLHVARGNKELMKAVRRSLTTAMDELGIPPSQIAILTTHRHDRDTLAESLAEDFIFVRWEDRSEDAIVCETVHRTKGLEREAIIYVDTDDQPNRTLAYVGTSRASAFLSIIGRQSLVDLVRTDDQDTAAQTM